MTLESDFQARIDRALNVPGGSTRVWRQWAGELVVTQRGRKRRIVGAPRGACDLTGYVRPEGWRLELEVKGPRTAVKPGQDEWHARCERDGCITLRVRYDESMSMQDNVDHVVERVANAIFNRRDKEGRCP